MTPRSWLRNLFTSRTPRTVRKAPARRLGLEALEDRELCAVYHTASVELVVSTHEPVWADLHAHTAPLVAAAGGETVGFGLSVGTFVTAGPEAGHGIYWAW